MPEHAGCCHHGVLFLNTTHHHAHMLGLDDHADALPFDGIVDAVGDLLC